MEIIHVPYGKSTLEIEVPGDVAQEEFLGCLVPRLNDLRPELEEADLVREALEHPIGTERLCRLAEGKRNIVVIASDHTRPVPSRIIAPLLLEEIRKGSPDAKITYLIATGCHRATTPEELEEKFGRDLVEREHFVVHDCDDRENLVEAGILPSGGVLILNRIAMEADLLVSEGFIEPHFFAGFSGGRKSVLPGVAARETVRWNHNAAFIADMRSRTGNLEGNLIHQDMRYAARRAGLAFICNVVLNARKKIIAAVAGDMEAAHQRGVDFLYRQCAVPRTEADIVITGNGGYPLDRNIYQSVKSMTAAEATVKAGGVIILAAEARDGHGGQRFYDMFCEEPELEALERRFLTTSPGETQVDQWQAQILIRVLKRATVICVSSLPDEMVENFHMIPAHSLHQALAVARRILGARGIQNSTVLVIPDGVSVMVEQDLLPSHHL